MKINDHQDADLVSEVQIYANGFNVTCLFSPFGNSPYTECAQEGPFGIPDRLDGHANQAERISTWRQPNEIQTGSGGEKYQLRFHPQRLARFVSAPFVSHASKRISIIGRSASTIKQAPADL